MSSRCDCITAVQAPGLPYQLPRQLANYPALSGELTRLQPGHRHVRWPRHGWFSLEQHSNKQQVRCINLMPRQLKVASGAAMLNALSFRARLQKTNNCHG